jgi:hypothetical protein
MYVLIDVLCGVNIVCLEENTMSRKSFLRTQILNQMVNSSLLIIAIQSKNHSPSKFLQTKNKDKRLMVIISANDSVDQSSN